VRIKIIIFEFILLLRHSILHYKNLTISITIVFVKMFRFLPLKQFDSDIKFIEDAVIDNRIKITDFI